MKKYKIVFSIAILIMFGTILFYQITEQKNLEEILAAYYQSLKNVNHAYLLFVIILIPINWYLESVKWRFMLLPKLHLANSSAFKAILAGVAVGFITPQRVGEYGGRLTYVPKENRALSLMATFFNSIAQNLANVFFGIIGVLIYLNYGNESSELNSILITSLILIALLAATYLWIPKILLMRQKWIPYVWRKHLDVLTELTNRKLLLNLVIALTRYFVYFVQILFLYKFLGVDLFFLGFFSAISIQLLLQSIIPIPPVFGIILNIELGLWIWSIFGVNEMVVISTVFGIWIFNLVIPSLFGMYFIQKRLAMMDKNEIFS